MLHTMAIIFAFLIFMFIMKNCSIILFNVSSVIILFAISLGVGYGIANTLLLLFKPLSMVVLGVIALMIIGVLFNR